MFWIEQLIPYNLFDIIIISSIVVLLSIALFVLWPHNLKKFAFRTNHKFGKYLVLAIGLTIMTGGATLAYTYFVEPNLLQVNAYAHDLPEISFDNAPLRVVIIGDIQYKAKTTPSFVEHIVETVNHQNPDLIFWVGDLVEYDSTELVNFGALKNLKARYGIYGVLGNHDYGINNHSSEVDLELANQVADKLFDSGFQILRNGQTKIIIRGVSINIIGMDDLLAEQTTFDNITTVPEEINLLLMHEPTSLYLNQNDLNFDLAFAGHCHGGQVDLGPLNALLGTPVQIKGCQKVQGKLSGLMNLDGVPLYLTRGAGGSYVRSRFNNPPEIMLVEIY